jgi:D-glycero-D-manno-heptose 1,7-bisphosphate phosphatase
MKRAVFLDRDGVLARVLVRDGKLYAPRLREEMEIDAEAPASLARLKAAGFLLIVVTNQPDVGRGITPRAEVEAMHERLRATLPLDECLVCYHDDLDACACRKPKPGLLAEAAVRHGIDCRGSFMIGDRWRDIDAGVAVGCHTVWIDRGYQERSPQQAPDARVTSLAEAVEWILTASAEL